jgi:hypothetical protein
MINFLSSPNDMRCLGDILGKPWLLQFIHQLSNLFFYSSEFQLICFPPQLLLSNENINKNNQSHQISHATPSLSWYQNMCQFQFTEPSLFHSEECIHEPVKILFMLHNRDEWLYKYEYSTEMLKRK